VAYLAGEPEYEVMILDMRDLLGRLGSCQIYLHHY
jgi:hypothetical protein